MYFENNDNYNSESDSDFCIDNEYNNESDVDDDYNNESDVDDYYSNESDVDDDYSNESDVDDEICEDDECYCNITPNSSNQEDLQEKVPFKQMVAEAMFWQPRYYNVIHTTKGASFDKMKNFSKIYYTYTSYIYSNNFFNYCYKNAFDKLFILGLAKIDKRGEYRLTDIGKKNYINDTLVISH